MEDNPFRSKSLDITYPVSEGAAGMERALEQLFSDAEMAVHSGDNIIILSDREADAELIAQLRALEAPLVFAAILDGREDAATADAFGAAHRNPQRFLEVLKDPHMGVFGVVTRGYAPPAQVMAVLKGWIASIAA